MLVSSRSGQFTKELQEVFCTFDFDNNSEFYSLYVDGSGNLTIYLWDNTIPGMEAKDSLAGRTVNIVELLKGFEGRQACNPIGE